MAYLTSRVADHRQVADNYGPGGGTCTAQALARRVATTPQYSPICPQAGTSGICRSTRSIATATCGSPRPCRACGSAIPCSTPSARSRSLRRPTSSDAALVVFPELGLAAYTSEDLFRQDALLEATLDAIEQVRAASEQLTPVIVVGAPLRAEQGLFNAAVVIHRGRDPRRGAQELPARVPRVLREAPVPGGPRPDQPDTSQIDGDDGPVRRRPAVHRHRPPELDAPRRDLRGRLGGDPAEHLRRARRRDRARQPLGQQHHWSASPTTGTCSAPRTRRARSAPTSTPPPGRASRRPTSPGTARR